MRPDASDGELRVRHVLSHEHRRLREVRLLALSSAPHAFGSTYEQNLERPSEFWEHAAAASGAGASERTFVLTDEGDRWHGMAFARLDIANAGAAWLGGMWVSPAARHRGGASSLCRACIAWAAERGARELTLTVVVGNDAAQRTYEAAGFQMRGRSERNYGERTLNEYVMARPL